MNKTDIRKYYRHKRMLLTGAEKNKLEDLMLIHFQQVNLDIPGTLMTYAPMEHFNEYDPHLVNKYCEFKNPGIQLYYPLVQSNNIIPILFSDETVFEKNAWGVSEPAHGIAGNKKGIDWILVPLLAFDNKGYRVGYGKGFYDSFLAGCRPDCLKFGFSFFDPVDRIDDINSHDIPLDICITPGSIYHFSD